MQITSPRVLAQLKVIVLALVIAVGGSYALGYSAWVGPTTSPTGNNADTPLNVGNNTQTKQGRLIVNFAGTDEYGLGVINKSTFLGTVEVGTTPSPAKIKIVDGTQANGSVLVSDATGLASWKATSTLGLGGAAGLDPDSFFHKMYTAPISYTSEAPKVGLYPTQSWTVTIPKAGDYAVSVSGYSQTRDDNVVTRLYCNNVLVDENNHFANNNEVNRFPFIIRAKCALVAGSNTLKVDVEGNLPHLYSAVFDVIYLSN